MSTQLHRKKPQAFKSLPPEAGAASQRERAYVGLRRVLILEQVPGGQRLREPEWAGRMGVNRTALREAFARLEAEGLIQRGVKTGYIVPSLSDQDVQEILRVRSVLECAAIDEICSNGRPDAKRLAPMRNACDDLEHLLERNYLLGVSEADRRFHEAMVDAAENKRLAMLYHRAPLPMIHRRVAESDHWLEQCQITLKEHRAVLTALLAGRREEGKKLLKEHLSERYLLPLRG